MSNGFQSTKRREAYALARAAIRAYEHKQSLENSWGVETAMRLIRKSRDYGLRENMRDRKDAA